MTVPEPAEMTIALLEGLAQWIADQGLALFSLSARYPTSPDLPVVSLQGLVDSPDRVYALDTYPVVDEVDLNDSTVGVQVISRGTTDKRTARRMDDALFALLHGVAGITLSGIPVVQAYRRSGVSLGRDNNRRWEQVSNYYLDVSWPTPTRAD